MKFTAIGRVDRAKMFPPQREVPETRQACLIECGQGDERRQRFFGELRTASDGTMTFIPEGPGLLLASRLMGGENGDK